MRSELRDNKAQWRDCGTVDEFAGQSPNMWDAWQLCKQLPCNIQVEQELAMIVGKKRARMAECYGRTLVLQIRSHRFCKLHAFREPHAEIPLLQFEVCCEGFLVHTVSVQFSTIFLHIAV